MALRPVLLNLIIQRLSMLSLRSNNWRMPNIDSCTGRSSSPYMASKAILGNMWFMWFMWFDVDINGVFGPAPLVQFTK